MSKNIDALDQLFEEAEESGLIPTITVRCCRDWPAVPGYRVGRCGLCGERPKLVHDE